MATPSSAKKIVVKKFEKYLEEYFGYKSFRDCQREIIEAVVKKKRDVSCVMPTGHGKSLCYQIPPLILENPESSFRHYYH
jgi:ATP-dependent DNA helicase RecQ